MLSVASITSIGIFLIPVVGVATWFLARRPRSLQGIVALISLGGLPFFIRARMSPQNQGVIMVGGPAGITGGSKTNPWPWVAIGMLFLIASLVVFLLKTRRRI
jgi:hypothetical protein